MIALKIWYDFRTRFLSSLTFFAIIAALHVFLFPFVRSLLVDWGEGVPGLESPETRRMAQDYAYYTASRWFGEIERSALFGILLALGGAITEGRSRAIFLTLSLPIKRTHWVYAQLGASMAGVFAMNAIGTLIVAMGGWLAGQPLPGSQVLLGALLMTIACAPYLAAAILASTYTGERLVAGMAAITFMVVTNKLDYFPSIARWLPETLANLLSGTGALWEPLASIVVCSAAFIMIAAAEFRRKDY